MSTYPNFSAATRSVTARAVCSIQSLCGADRNQGSTRRTHTFHSWERYHEQAMAKRKIKNTRRTKSHPRTETNCGNKTHPHTIPWAELRRECYARHTGNATRRFGRRRPGSKWSRFDLLVKAENPTTRPSAENKNAQKQTHNAQDPEGAEARMLRK